MLRKHSPSKGTEILALSFAMTFPTLMAWLYFVALSPQGAEAGPGGNPGLQIGYAAGKIIQFSFPLLYLGWYEPRRLRPGRPHFRGLVVSVLFGIVVGIGILLLYHLGLRDWLLRTGTTIQLKNKVQEFDAATPIRYLGLAAFLSVIHSLLEEYYWRWFVFGRLREDISLSLAILLSSLAFMAHHVVVLYVYLPGQFLEAVVPFSLGIAAGGAVWAWLYNRHGSIYSPWISHLLVDCAIMTVGYDLLFTQ